VLNATNWDRVEFIAGNDDSDMWSGVRVTLFTELATFAGKTGPAVRVKPAPKRPATPTPQQPAQDPRPRPPASSGQNLPSSDPEDDNIPFSPEWR